MTENERVQHNSLLFFAMITPSSLQPGQTQGWHNDVSCGSASYVYALRNRGLV
jgi:hypothetical protein